VNRLWDAVFSEICEHLSVRSAVQKHVRDHLRDFVTLHTERVDGRVLAKSGGNRIWWGRNRGEIHTKYYVDPDNGLLRETRNYYAIRRELRAGWRPKPSRDELTLADGRRLRKVAGIWYEITELLPEQRRMVCFVFWNTKDARLVRVPSATPPPSDRKRQLNSRELSKLRQTHADFFSGGGDASVRE
jgi:hypothetical protein